MAGAAAGKLLGTVAKNPQAARKVTIAVALAVMLVPVMVLIGGVVLIGQAATMLAIDEHNTDHVPKYG